MKDMTLFKIAHACKGTLVDNREEHKENPEVQGVVIDSRLVQPGYLFVATKGERVDGHSFIPQVIEQGAVGIICEQIPNRNDIPYILVKDSLIALQEIAEYYRSTLSIPFIGITGSVGKTSTKEFIAGVLARRYHVLKTQGNYNNEVGVPLTILQIREEHEVAVLEMGINHFGEMHRLSKMVRPDICVMTNIGQCHLEFLGSREGILSAKSEIFDYMRDTGTVCVNGDDDMLQTIDAIHGKSPISYGLSPANQIYAGDIEDRGLHGSLCKLHLKEGIIDVKIPLMGRHMIYNALAAAAVGQLLGLSLQEIAEGIASVEALSGRNHVITTDHYTVIDDCYNANPISMQAAIDTLVTAPGRTVAILGDMGELGDDVERLHTQVGAYCAAKGVDLLLCVGDLSQYIAQGAAEQSKTHTTTIVSYLDKECLMQALPIQLQRGDTILVKASHFMRFETIIQALCS
ncbi:MAG: UDP-N-acetylmuramoyl-tripeptide--D-alanyl-D-alanine ligase [Lachnospiraceae bacterium]